MTVSMLKAKLHRARVTDANLDYEGSISICPKLCEAAQLFPFEKVDVLNITNGARLTTYVIYGDDGEICLNGAAARHAQKNDKVIIAAYVDMSPQEAAGHHPRLIQVDANNEIKAT